MQQDCGDQKTQWKMDNWYSSHKKKMFKKENLWRKLYEGGKSEKVRSKLKK